MLLLPNLYSPHRFMLISASSHNQEIPVCLFNLSNQCEICWTSACEQIPHYYYNRQSLGEASTFVLSCVSLKHLPLTPHGCWRVDEVQCGDKFIFPNACEGSDHNYVRMIYPLLLIYIALVKKRRTQAYSSFCAWLYTYSALSPDFPVIHVDQVMSG